MKRKLTLIVNGMPYGDVYTKKCLWTVFVLGVAGFGCLLVGGALSLYWLFAVAVVLFIVDFLIYRSLDMSVGTMEKIEDPDECLDEQAEKITKLHPKEATIHKSQSASYMNYSEHELKKLFQKKQYAYLCNG